MRNPLKMRKEIVAALGECGYVPPVLVDRRYFPFGVVLKNTLRGMLVYRYATFNRGEWSLRADFYPTKNGRKDRGRICSATISDWKPDRFEKRVERYLGQQQYAARRAE